MFAIPFCLAASLLSAPLSDTLPSGLKVPNISTIASDTGPGDHCRWNQFHGLGSRAQTCCPSEGNGAIKHLRLNSAG